jgi:glycerol uptake operon antiterminator
MDKKVFFQLMDQYPIAAATTSLEDQNLALNSRVALIFLLKGDAFSLSDFIERAHQQKKGVGVHIDLISGIGKDRAGIQYLRQQGVDAIITSRSHLIAAGKAEGLITIQRLLLLERSAMEAGIKTIIRAQPDIVEVLPGVIFPDMVGRLRQHLSLPLITGGFIRTLADVERVRAAGALLCSSSTQELWS